MRLALLLAVSFIACSRAEPTPAAAAAASAGGGVPAFDAAPAPRPRGAWTAAGNLSKARGHLAVAAGDDGAVFVIGGTADDLRRTDLADTEVLRPGAAWSAAPKLLVARSWARATTTPAGDVLVFGGLSNLDYLASVERLARGAASWRMVGEMPYREEVIDVAVLRDGRILVVSRPQDKEEAHAAVLDPVRGRWTRMRPLEGSDLANVRAFAGVGSTAILVGASAPSRTGPSRRCEPLRVLDVSTGAWTTRAGDFPICAGVAGTRLDDGRILVVGGWSMRLFESSNQAFLIDPDGRVTRAAPMKVARFGPGLASLGHGRVLVVGASPTTENGGSAAFRTAEIYDAAANRWEDAPPPPERFSNAHGIAVGEGRAVFVADRSAKAWSYEEK